MFPALSTRSKPLNSFWLCDAFGLCEYTEAYGVKITSARIMCGMGWVIRSSSSWNDLYWHVQLRSNEPLRQSLLSGCTNMAIHECRAESGASRVRMVGRLTVETVDTCRPVFCSQ